MIWVAVPAELTADEMRQWWEDEDRRLPGPIDHRASCGAVMVRPAGDTLYLAACPLPSRHEIAGMEHGDDRAQVDGLLALVGVVLPPYAYTKPFRTLDSEQAARLMVAQ